MRDCIELHQRHPHGSPIASGQWEGGKLVRPRRRHDSQRSVKPVRLVRNHMLTRRCETQECGRCYARRLMVAIMGSSRNTRAPTYIRLFREHSTVMRCRTICSAPSLS